LQREKLRTRAGRRAWKFEERLAEGRGRELVRRCWEEMRRRLKRGRELSKWERERKEFFEERGWEISEVEGKREEGSLVFDELEKRDIEEQRKRRWERVTSSSYIYRQEGTRG